MDAAVKAWQEYLKTSPLGVGYTGPSDGEINDPFKTAIKVLEVKLKTGGHPLTILVGAGVATPVAIAKTVIDQISTQNLVNTPSTQTSANSPIAEWKKYLQGKGLYSGDVNSPDIDDAFKRGMISLEGLLTKDIPAVSGMIWQGSALNPNATIADVEESLNLLQKHKQTKTSSLNIERFGVADFDSLGPPGEDQRSTIFNQMFISQEDSKLDEHTPGKNQNQGRWLSDIPQKTEEEETPKQQENSLDIDERMQLLIDLMDSVKK